MDPVQRVGRMEGGEDLRATLVENSLLTPSSIVDEVRELSFDVQSGVPELSAGQIVAIHAPGSREFGNAAHVRLYTIADVADGAQGGGAARIKLCVRRCSYIDEYSGERYPGVASNFLCNLSPGDAVEMRGPFPIPFEVPEERSADLVLIGSGTGIAPFRAFVRHVFEDVPDWKGRIWMFYGARTGLEMMYMNDLRDDFSQYYDLDTFRAFKALATRPGWHEGVDWGSTLEEHGAELWEMLGSPKTYVYIAGLEKMLSELDRVFARIAGSEAAWARRKAELQAGHRWMELVY